MYTKAAGFEYFKIRQSDHFPAVTGHIQKYTHMTGRQAGSRQAGRQTLTESEGERENAKLGVPVSGHCCYRRVKHEPQRARVRGDICVGELLHDI